MTEKRLTIAFLDDCAYDAAGRLASVARSGAAFGALSGSVDRCSCNARGEVTLARRTKGGLPVRGFSEDFAYDLAGNRTSSATYDEDGAARTSTYAANGLNQYASRTSPGFAAMRGEADTDATVTVNGRPAFRLGAYFFGGDEFDNSETGGFATLVAYAAKAQTDEDGGDADDLVSCATGRVYVARSAEAFEYDADGNQTLVTTTTGRWRVEYDGENRPVRWTRESDGKVVAMSYDHLGRRRTKDGTRFYYDGYLQVANERTVSNEVVRESFVWDPTEPAATRPLAWVDASGAMRLYAHDWNKNVSEVVSGGADAEVLAHYDYAAFGAVVAQSGACADANPWRFSSEYEDSDLGLVYYNYRHYDPLAGRWLQRDPIEEDGGVNLYAFCNNGMPYKFDMLGTSSCCRNGKKENCDSFYKWEGTVTTTSVTWGLGATFLMIDMKSNFVCMTCSRWRIHLKAVLLTASLGAPVSFTGSNIEFGNVPPDDFVGSVSLLVAGVGAMGVVEASSLRIGNAMANNAGLVGGAELGVGGAYGWFIDFEMTEE